MMSVPRNSYEKFLFKGFKPERHHRAHHGRGGVKPAHAYWHEDLSNPLSITVPSVSASISPTNTSYNPSDNPPSKSGASQYSEYQYHWIPGVGEPTTPNDSAQVSHLLSFTNNITASITPNPQNPGPTRAEAKMTLYLYNTDPFNENPDTPDIEEVYGASAYYDYRSGQVVQSDTTQGSYTESRTFNVIATFDENNNPLFKLRPYFRFNLKNEASVSTTSRGLNAAGFVQGGSGDANSGSNTATTSGIVIARY